MDLRRLRIGEWAVAAVGLLLLLALFLPWYEMAGVSVNAWESFSVTDVILAVLAIAAIAVVPVAARAPTPSPAIAHETLTLLASLVAVPVVLFRVLDPPGGGLSRAAGAYTGLLCVIGLVAASLIAMRDERLSSPGNLTDPTGVPVAAAPEMETLPAPRC
ncbi:MAG: hypothetical protein ACR2J6_07630 [Thermoleophilaceae bacterium]